MSAPNASKARTSTMRIGDVPPIALFDNQMDALLRAEYEERR